MGGAKEVSNFERPREKPGAVAVSKFGVKQQGILGLCWHFGQVVLENRRSDIAHPQVITVDELLSARQLGGRQTHDVLLPHLSQLAVIERVTRNEFQRLPEIVRDFVCDDSQFERRRHGIRCRNCGSA